MKKTFIAYLDRYDYAEDMNAEEKANLFDCIFSYQKWNDVNPLPALKYVRNKIKKFIDADREKYKDICDRNKKKASARWSPTASEPVGMQTDAAACRPMQTDADRCSTMPDNDNDNDIIINKVKDNNKIKKNKDKEDTPNGVPTPDGVVLPIVAVPPENFEMLAGEDLSESEIKTYGNQDIQKVLWRVKDACKKYIVAYGWRWKMESRAARRLLSKKFQESCLDEVKMELPVFIDSIIMASSRLKWWDTVNSAVSIYYERSKVVNRSRQEMSKKSQTKQWTAHIE